MLFRPPLAGAFFAIPGDLAAPTGGYAYARQVLHALPALTHLKLPGGFPLPDQAVLEEAASLLAAVPAEAVLLVDGLALGALPVWCLDRVRAPIVALVHHPLYLETGRLTPVCNALFQSERAALAQAVAVIATSATTAALLSNQFGVPAERLSVAEPGTDPAERSPRGGTPPKLLAVGAVVPRKGYEVLVAALAGLTDLPWTLTIAGALDRDVASVERVASAILAQGLAERVNLAGAVEPAMLEQLYRSADIFVSASLYEGYGMAAAEATARGLPVVASLGGALAATIPSGAALTCPPGDVEGLRDALARMLTNGPVRTACAEAAWAAGQKLPRWQQTAGRIADVLACCGRVPRQAPKRSPRCSGAQ